MVQAWYQGGVDIFDWTDVDNPFEIAYHDRGPVDGTRQGSARGHRLPLAGRQPALSLRNDERDL